MAKIFRTEELSVNGDNIRISAEAGNLIFKDGSGNKVTSTDDRTQEVSSLAFKDLDLDSDVSSLKTEISDSVDAANTDLDADISSLQAQRTSDVSDLDGDVSSLQAQRTSDVSDLDGDVSSLQAQRTSDVSDLDGDVSSLQAQRTGDHNLKTQEVSSLAFKDLDLDSDVSSLKTEISDSVDAANTDLDADISSLQAQRTSDVSDLDGDVSSLQAQRTSDVSDLDGDVSSLQAQRTSDVSDLDGDVSSLAYLASQNDVVATEAQVWTSGVDPVDGVDSVTVDLGREFLTTPRVIGILKSSNTNDPIVGLMLKEVTGGSGNNHSAVFVFSDEIASANYRIEVLASI